MADKKTFTVNVNGIDKAYNQAISLRNALDQLSGSQINLSTTASQQQQQNEAASTSIEGLKKKIAELNKEYQNMSFSEQQIAGKELLDKIHKYELLLSRSTDAQRRQNEITQNAVAIREAEKGSIEQLNLKIKQLKEQYEKLSEADRESSKGSQLLLQIDDLEKSLNKLNKMSDSHLDRLGALGRGLNNINYAIEESNKSVSSLSDIFSSGNEVLNAFGISNDYLTETVDRLGKIVEATSKIQALSTALTEKDSIVMQIATAAKRIYTTTVLSSSKALGVFKGAMLATGVGAFILLIGHLVANFDSLKKQLANAFGGMEKFNKVIETAEPIVSGLGNVILQYLITPLKIAINTITRLIEVFNLLKDGEYSEALDKMGQAGSETLDIFVDGFDVMKHYKDGVDMAAESSLQMTKILEDAAKKASESIAPFKNLQNQWNSLGDDLNKKKQFIKDNQREFEKLGVQVDNVKDAENLFEKNSGNFINSMIARAKATAAQELAITKYKEAIAEKVNGSIEKSEQLSAEADKLMKEFTNFSKDADKYLADSGVKAPKKKSGGSQKDNKAENDKKAKEEFLKREEEYQEALKKLKDESLKRDVDDNLNKNKENREELIKAQKAELALKEQFQQDELDAETRQYEELKAKAELLGQSTVELTKAWQERKKLLQDKFDKDEIKLKEEHIKTLLELDKKKKQDTNNELKDGLAEEKKITEKHYQEIQELQTNATKKKDNGLLDVEKTRENLTEIKNLLSAYQIELDASYTKRKELFDKQLALYEDDSKEYKDILEQKTASDKEYEKKNKEVNKAIEENTKGLVNLQSDYFKSLSTKMTEVWGKINEGMTAAMGVMNALITSQVEDIKEKLAETTKQYDAVVAKKKESDDKIKSLEEEAKNASGGRAMVLQEQIARQMDANASLAQQEKELAKQKEKLEKEQAKKERQQKKMEAGKKILEAGVNTAVAVTAVLPNFVKAAIVGAMGAAQIAVAIKNYSKLEDGGLLQGKRHKQGGMRIEGTNIEVEGDEYVVNRISTQKNLGLISYINKNRKELRPEDVNNYFMRTGNISQAERSFSTRKMYEDGGQLTNLEVMDAMNAPNNDKILEAISQINFKPVVSVVDIASAQKNVTDVKDIAGV